MKPFLQRGVFAAAALLLLLAALSPAFAAGPVRAATATSVATATKTPKATRTPKPTATPLAPTRPGYSEAKCPITVAGLPGNVDRDQAGPGMFDHIRQGFLKNAINVDLGFRRKEMIDFVHHHLALYIMITAGLVHQISQRRRQAQIFQTRGTEVPGQPADIFNDRIDIRQHVFTICPQVLLIRRQIVLNGHEIDFQNRQGLTQFVMQFPGDPPALLFLDAQKLGRQPPQFLLEVLAQVATVAGVENQVAHKTRGQISNLSPAPLRPVRRLRGMRLWLQAAPVRQSPSVRKLPTVADRL